MHVFLFFCTPNLNAVVLTSVHVAASMFKDFDNGEEDARLRQVDDKIEPDGVER